MRSQFVGGSLGLVALCTLAGCVADTPHPEALADRTPGGYWEDCLEAIDHGVEGDRCDFDPDETGTALTCATSFPPEVVGWEMIGSQRVPVASAELDVFAHCRSGSLILNRRHELESNDALAPTPMEDGCLRFPSPDRNDLLTREPDFAVCVAEGLLPDVGMRDGFDIDRPSACVDILDGVARPGDPCVGETVCASAAADDAYTPPSFVHRVGRPGVYAWCGAGRLRLAATLIELPCDEFDAERDMYVCTFEPGQGP